MEEVYILVSNMNSFLFWEYFDGTFRPNEMSVLKNLFSLLVGQSFQQISKVHKIVFDKFFFIFISTA